MTQSCRLLRWSRIIMWILGKFTEHYEKHPYGSQRSRKVRWQHDMQDRKVPKRWSIEITVVFEEYTFSVKMYDQRYSYNPEVQKHSAFSGLIQDNHSYTMSSKTTSWSHKSVETIHTFHASTIFSCLKWEACGIQSPSYDGLRFPYLTTGCH